MSSTLIKRWKPSKKWGQNFLINKETSSLVIKSFNLKKNINILEIGPGFGALTDFLNVYATRLILVEKDCVLYKHLMNKFNQNKKIKICYDDILNFNLLDNLNQFKFDVVGNLPFSSAIKILKWCFKNRIFFHNLYLSFSEKVANKILNSRKNNLLKILCQLNSNITKACSIPAINFNPKPKVNVVFIHFQLKKPINLVNDSKFIDFLKFSFRNPRKTFINNIKSITLYDLSKILNFLNTQKIPKNIRAEDLTLQNFIDIYFFIMQKQIN